MSSDTTPRPVLHHVTLKTNRVQEMIDWYGTVVGMTTNHHSQFGAWMTNDGANHRVALLAHPALSDDPDKIPPTSPRPKGTRPRWRGTRPVCAGGHVR